MAEWLAAIRPGEVIQAMLFAGMILAFFFNMKGAILTQGLQLKFLNEKIDIQAERIEEFTKLLRIMERYDERLLNLEKSHQRTEATIDGLRRGEGYVIQSTRAP